MKYATIKGLQKSYGYAELQRLIDSGDVWYMEGALGRAAMDALTAGACMLPTTSRRGAYGNIIPSRYQVKQGTYGSFHNSVKFYTTNEELF
jgi:hypothetical protein